MIALAKKEKKSTALNAARRAKIVEQLKARWAAKKRAPGLDEAQTPAAFHPEHANGKGNGAIDQSLNKTEIGTTLNSIDALKKRAREIAGVDSESEFNRLPKKEQNAIFAQIRSEKNPPKINGSRHDVATSAVSIVNLDLVDRSPFNREHFDPVKNAELIASVRKHGVMQPGIARPHPTKPGRYELVAGERRMRASREVGLRTMELKIQELSDEEAIEMQAIENLHREDLNPLDEAVKYQQFIEICEKRGMASTDAVEHVAERLGKSKSTIYESLRLLKLPEEAKQALSDGRLPASHAGLIAKLEKNPEVQSNAVKTVLKPGNQNSKNETGVLSFRATKQLVEESEERIRNISAYNKLRDEFLKRHDLVLTTAENKKIFTYASDYKNTDLWAELDDHSGQPGHQYVEWKKLVGKKLQLVSRALAQAPSGKPVVLYPITELKEQAKANGTKFSSRSEEGPNADERRRKAKAKRDAVVRDATLEQIVERMTSSHTVGSKQLWELITFAIADHFMHSDSSKAVARRRGLDAKDGYGSVKSHARTLQTERELQAFTVELLIGGGCYHYPDVLKKAAALFGVDMVAIEKQFQTSGK